MNELAFVTELVRRIVEDGWGPVELWRGVQAAAAQQHESRAQEQTAQEAADARRTT